MNQEWLDKIKAEPGVPGVTLTLIAEIEQLQAEVDRLKLYTDPKLFAAASNVPQKEKVAIADLEKLAEKWPDSLWIFASGGKLNAVIIPLDIDGGGW